MPLLLKIVFFNAAMAFANAPAVEFRSTKNIHASPQIPLPAQCESKSLAKNMKNSYMRQLGSCGSTQKLYEEANRVRKDIFVKRIANTGLPPEPGDACETERRVALQESVIDAYQVVDGAVKAEEERLAKICSADRAQMEEWRAFAQAHCVEPARSAAVNLARGFKGDLDEVVAEGEKIKKAYQKQLDADMTSIAKEIAAARACEKRLK